MNSPRDPRGAQPKQASPAIDIKHQLGLVATAGMVPQPGHPHLPPINFPGRVSNLAATKGTKVEKG